MKAVALTASPREARGRNEVKKRRAEGRVPAGVYGAGTDVQALEVSGDALGVVLTQSAGGNALVDLTIEGGPAEPALTLIKEVQHHPLSRKVLHVDFQAVDPTKQVTIKAPVETTGEAVGVKAGGLLEHARHEVELRGLPRALPEVVEVDISNLDVGEHLTIGQLTLPEGVEALGDPEVVILLVAAPRKEEEGETAEGEAGVEAGAETAQPEVITEKKAEDAGDAQG